MKEVCVFVETRKTKSIEPIAVQGFPKLYGVVFKLSCYFFSMEFISFAILLHIRYSNDLNNYVISTAIKMQTI